MIGERHSVGAAFVSNKWMITHPASKYKEWRSRVSNGKEA